MLDRIGSALVKHLTPVASSQNLAKTAAQADTSSTNVNLQEKSKKKEEETDERTSDESAEDIEKLLAEAGDQEREALTKEEESLTVESVTEMSPEAQKIAKERLNFSREIEHDPDLNNTSSTFIDVIQKVRSKKGLILSWIGGNAYQESLKERAKAGKFRKGAMMDERVGG